MFQTFTGNSRRPRQVNLSGRNPNPFATFGSPNKPAASHNALATAQQDRLARQQERERQKAAVSIQRTWRGHSTREAFHHRLREEWSTLEDADANSAMDLDTRPEAAAEPYASDKAALERGSMLLRFLNFRHKGDIGRLALFCHRLDRTIQSLDLTCESRPWLRVYLRIEAKCLRHLENGREEDQEQVWSILRFVSLKIKSRDLEESLLYYRALSKLAPTRGIDLQVALAPLRFISPATLYSYQGLVLLLMVPHLEGKLNGATIVDLASEINCKVLGGAIARSIKDKTFPFGSKETAHEQHLIDAKSWLLGYLIFFYQHAHKYSSMEYAADSNFIFSVSTILSSIADDIELETPASDMSDPDSRRNPNAVHSVDPFVQNQILSLLNQESVGGLMAKIGPRNDEISLQSESQNEITQVLASYILTLLRLFPRRADDIRMWLYLGNPNISAENSDRLPVIKLFWSAIKSTEVFNDILRNPQSAVRLLKPHGASSAGSDKEWRVIFIFMELYSFILKVMDDEEFFAGSKLSFGSQDVSDMGRQNTLPLGDLQIMTTFLKHLGFTMYYNAPDILDDGSEPQSADISSLFRPQDRSTTTARTDRRATFIAGIHGVSLDYLKGLVTGLLRAIYERDSRRQFLPKGHWLMTSRFDMTNFIDAVVEEEERRHQIQEEDDEDDFVEDRENSSGPRVAPSPLIGTGHAQRLQRNEQMQREQRKASRKRYLQAVAPRLEILQNMPFLIPFTTRVQIFRRFVRLDQTKRRHGFTDPDVWRTMMAEVSNPLVNPLERHQAKIRRNHEFEDAYDQFYELGSALKEPISITFVDQFDQPEAGIDGGGVTKEFLTSVTNQAFSPGDGIQLFVENDQHLLYPNPSAIDEQKELLKEVGFSENSPTFRASITELLQKYEFLGRIIGKCLYEGILVDIGFAGFFLLKWALTGGTGSAPRESGYRANLNDLRDLDEGLYQGLLKLKNYAGNVEDFSLDFTVTDTLNIPTTAGKQPHTKTITRELKPGGLAMSVTNSNRLAYISYMAHHRLSWQPLRQTIAFHKGLSAIVQPSWLSMFNQSELQTLIGGAPAEIDVGDLRRNTVYGGVYQIGDDGQEHPSVKIFWEVMQEIKDADRRKVLKFVTSTPRAPLLGFGSLNPRFSIKDSGGDEKRLPSTSTCMNLLKLPRFSSKKVCKDKLLQAVNSGAGFDLS